MRRVHGRKFTDYSQLMERMSGRRPRLRRVVLATAVAGLGLSLVQGAPALGSGGGLTGPTLPLNDLEAMLSLTGAQLADQLPARTIPAPRLHAVPRAKCGPGSIDSRTTTSRPLIPRGG